ncbi:MAG: hypothetical protein CMJ48_07330 [Planctomycetaceae bacterium]|nr:hypothetical protein [Planctomycetaceae bacterium]
MKFGMYCLHGGLMSGADYAQVVTEQLERTLPGDHKLKKDLVLNSFEDGDDWDACRPTPFGDVLNDQPFASEVYENADVSGLKGLVEQWRQWHLDNLEPICEYPIGSQFGSQMYVRQHEKKRAARFITAEPAQDGTPLILDGDIVVIPEGSSALYVGLAIAAFRKNVTIITCNGALIREYHDNPALAGRLKELIVIGGSADYDKLTSKCEHASVRGDTASRQFESAIASQPRATVVISSVNGLLPDKGPFAPDGPAAAMRAAMLYAAIQADVRQVVFVADYSKHRPSQQHLYSVPMYAEDVWSQMLEQNRTRFSIVTVPPPALRDEIRLGDFDSRVERRVIMGATIPALRTAEVREYDMSAKKFDDILRADDFTSRFYEVLE